jgi:penicillin-binding protein 2
MPLQTAIKDPYRERRIYFSRTLVAGLVVVLLFGLLAYRYYDLQVQQHEIYKTQSERNRVHIRAVPPVRGMIYDRNGVLLADNRPSHRLSLVYERVPDLDQTLARLRAVVAISEDEEDTFRKRLQSRRPFEPVPLRFQLSEQEIASLAVNRHTLAGVEVEAQPSRFYPGGALFAHALGYVGRISEREVTRLDPVNYAGTHNIGKVGVEKYYEHSLHGEVGYEHVETNARGQVLRVLERIEPVSGRDLHLHLDTGVQQVAMEALAGWRGSAVAVEVESGGVVALVSSPAYDPNLFVDGISRADYRALNSDPDLPLFNRTVLGQYPPASTIKPLVGLAGLELGLVDAEHRIADPGWYRLPNDERKYRDWKRGGHARNIGLHESIVQSCDVYFFDLAHRMGIDRYHDFVRQFGLGQPSGIDLATERPGLLPSRQWKRQHKHQPWYPGETLNAGIGQGYMLATPVQLAVATATVANRGRVVTPRLLRSVADEVPVYAPGREFQLQHPENWELIREAMADVIHSPRGTAQVISSGLGYRMAGKTGTAQVVGIAQDAEYDRDKLAERNRDHALFVGFAPLENPRIAVAVVVENGESSSIPARITRKVIDAYLSKG